MHRLLKYGLTAGMLIAVAATFTLQLSLPYALNAAADTPDPEDELKAATVLAFLQNARWPESDPGGAYLTLGVLGRPALAAVLRRAIQGKPVNGRLIRVLELTLPADPRCCQAFYLATDRKAEIRRALAGAAPGHVLTMGESTRFLEEGGAINLFLVDGHMAFEVSMATLEESRVTISSKLLRFGRVHDGTKARGPQ